MPDLAALTASARGILPAAVAVVASDPTATAAAIWPSEQLRGAIAARQREFSAGRSAARQALSLLGHAQTAIPQGSDRAPVWPLGIAGSITHSATLCLAAVTRAPMLIGIDLEPDTPLAPDLWDVILLPAESAALSGHPRAAQLAKLIFSAKEATYKAQYPRSKTLFGFDTIHISLFGAGFSARFTHAVPEFPADTILHGQFTRVDSHILTTVTA